MTRVSLPACYPLGMPTRPPTHDDDLRRLGIMPDRKAYDRAYDRARGQGGTSATIERLRKSARWFKVRDLVRRRDPLCVRCLELGLTTPTDDIDHIEPARLLVERGDLERFYDSRNLRGLCRPCHARHGAK